MDRRQVLGVLGSSLGVGIGGYGLQRKSSKKHHNSSSSARKDMFLHGSNDTTSGSSPTGVPTGETRTGTTLSGISPRSFTSSYVQALQAWLGTRQAILVFFADMERSPAEIDRTIELLETIWNWGYVPHLFWQPNFGETDGTVQPVTATVAAGEYDDEIGAWASALSDWAIRPPREPDRRVYINLAPELNGDWVPWGIPTPDTSPERYVGMWRRIRELVMDTDLRRDHVQWLWTVNNTSSEPVDLPACYPGDEYVDWVGVTGYNWMHWGGWQPPASVYGPMLDIVREITDRPVAVSEFGASADCADGHCPQRKNEWITAAYDYLTKRDVRMMCWFDHRIEKDGTDWGVFDTEVGPDRFTHGATVYRVYDRYRDAIRRNDVLGSHPVDARRLTDSEFQGALIDAPARGEKHRAQESIPR